MQFLSILLTACLFAITATPVLSHHGRSNFRYDVSTTLEGEVVDFQWRNPHVYIDLKATNENNETAVWLIEAGTPSALKRQGWSKDAFGVGDKIVAVGNPNRNPEKKHLYLQRIVLENGQTLNLASTKRLLEIARGNVVSTDHATDVGEINKPTIEPAITPSQDFSGTWARGPNNYLTTAYFEPPTDWPLTEQGEAQLARFDEHDNPAYDCLDRGLPFFSVMPYWLAWTRYEDRIEIELQNVTLTRTLHFNQDSHPDDLKPDLMGHSIARIKDDGSLVVDTAGFAATRWGLAPGIDSSEQKRVRERYTLDEDGLGMAISLTFMDPVYLTEPVTVQGTYRKVVDTPFEPYECDLEAARRSLSLWPNRP